MTQESKDTTSDTVSLICAVVIAIAVWFLVLHGPYVGQTVYFPNGTSAKIVAINGDFITLDKQMRQDVHPEHCDVKQDGKCFNILPGTINFSVVNGLALADGKKIEGCDDK
jgi:hypothetical protein